MDNRLKTPRKTNYEFEIVCNYKAIDGDGNVVNLPFDLTNYSVTFAVKERKDSKAYLIAKIGTVDDAVNGIASINLEYTDTDIPPRVYIYGILLENSITSDRRELMVENPFFEIEPGIVYEPVGD